MKAGLRAAALALSLAIAATASAAEPPQCAGRDLSGVAGLGQAKAKRADDLVNADGLLWRVEKPGLPVSYLFGTVHSTDEGAMALARRAADKLAEVKIVATELGSMDAAEKANLGALTLKAGLDRDHDTLEALPPADRAAVEKLMKDLGYPPEFVHRLKLWFLAVLAATPSCETKREALELPEVDMYLADAAQAAGLRVVGLEQPEDQIDAIAAIDPEISATLLALAARDPELNDDVYTTLLALYRQGRPAEISGGRRPGRRHERKGARRAGFLHPPTADRPQPDDGRPRRSAPQPGRLHCRRRPPSLRQGRVDRTAPPRRLHGHEGVVTGASLASQASLATQGETLTVTS